MQVVVRPTGNPLGRYPIVASVTAASPGEAWVSLVSFIEKDQQPADRPDGVDDSGYLMQMEILEALRRCLMADPGSAARLSYVWHRGHRQETGADRA